MTTQAVEAVDLMLTFAREARATMCEEFNVQYVAEIALMAMMRTIERTGQCKNGLKYFIHGFGYDVYATEGAGLLIDANIVRPRDRPIRPEDGVFDKLELVTMQLFLQYWLSVEYPLNEVDAACQTFCERGILRRRTPRVFELLQEDQIAMTKG